MNGLKMRHLLAIPLIVLLIISIAARCTELKPAADRLVHVPNLMKAHQDSADKRAPLKSCAKQNCSKTLK